MAPNDDPAGAAPRTNLEHQRRWRDHLREAGESAADVTIGLASTVTVDPLVPYLGSHLLERGLSSRAALAEYNQVFQACMDWRSAFGRGPDDAPLDVVVLLWRLEELVGDELRRDLAGDDSALPDALAKVADLAGALARLVAEFPGSIVVSLPPAPELAELDPRSLTAPTTSRRFHAAVVAAFLDGVAALERVTLLDLEAVQRELGASRVRDPRKWYLYRQPYHEDFWREVGADLARIVAVQRCQPKKVLVVDCDNTLWGGIVGEDLIDGIALSDDFPGSVFRDVQRQLVALHDRGVLICLASKNDAEAVWEVFDKHDAMVLQREHVAAAAINWEPKSQNIIGLAAQLNLGIDSFVFLDDNPVEIQEVSLRAPEVTCLQVPEELTDYPALLRECRLFDRLSVTDEDRQRTRMMQVEADRRDAASAMSEEEYLATLQLRVDVFEPGPEHLGRVAQLINKTNQFNLTTRRRSLDEVQALAARDDHHLFAMTVQDRFGDYGLVGVAVARREPESWVLDTLLMSCRVLGRGVETALLARLAGAAGSDGAAQLVGEYLPTRKNGMVADLFARHGFEEQGGGRWCIASDAGPEVPAHVNVG